MAEAARYVASLLPEPLADGPIQVEWRFIPSTQLGGDSFGYHWLDDDHFAFYLLDVSGHGVGASLMSVSAMNVLVRTRYPASISATPGKCWPALTTPSKWNGTTASISPFGMAYISRASDGFHGRAAPTQPHFCSPGQTPPAQR